MMFGDMGHGSILVFFSGYLILNAKKLKQAGPTMKSILELRYIFFLMGLMSTYAGMIYNEFFAIPTNMFGSCY